jgi:hypothetical protein
VYSIIFTDWANYYIFLFLGFCSLYPTYSFDF